MRRRFRLGHSFGRTPFGHHQVRRFNHVDDDTGVRGESILSAAVKRGIELRDAARKATR